MSTTKTANKSETARAVPSSRLGRSGPDYLFTFHAMATPCEVRLETEDAALAEVVARVAETEARRIEQKFSRYKSDSVIGRINAGGGKEMVVDGETAHLLDFADECFEVSEGLFDVTSGVLRRIWKFDGSDRVPTDAQIASLRSLVGWQKVSWKPPAIILPAGMEIDLGGLAKEYAVDKALGAIREVTPLPVLVNFGGDLRVSGPRKYGMRWKVAIESVEKNATNSPECWSLLTVRLRPAATRGVFFSKTAFATATF